MHKNINMSSFKSSENIQKKECGPDRSVSDNQSSSVTLNEMLAFSKNNKFLDLQKKRLYFLYHNTNGTIQIQNKSVGL